MPFLQGRVKPPFLAWWVLTLSRLWTIHRVDMGSKQPANPELLRGTMWMKLHPMALLAALSLPGNLFAADLVFHDDSLLPNLSPSGSTMAG